MKGYTVNDWMTRNPITISSRTTIPEAYWIMVEKKIRRLLVVEDKELMGIVTIEDLRQKIPLTAFAIHSTKASDILSHCPVSKVMSVEPITIESKSQLITAANLMIHNHISTLPVVDKSDIVGIITESDIFRAFLQLLESKS